MDRNDPRSEKQKMLAGDPYRADCDELSSERLHAERLCRAYNATGPDEALQRATLFGELPGRAGERVFIRPPFYCDYGYNIRLGERVFLNFGCVFLDVVSIEIGDLCQIGAGVQVLTADHPRDPALRRKGLENGKPVRIGHNVWIGSGALILPGVTIGDDAIIGAGSVVTCDVPGGATIGGNPARILQTRVSFRQR